MLMRTLPDEPALAVQIHVETVRNDHLFATPLIFGVSLSLSLHTHTHTLSLSLSYSLSPTLTLTLSHSHTVSLSHSHSHSLSLSLSLSLTFSLSLSRSFSYSHSLSLTLFHSLSLSLTHSLLLSHCLTHSCLHDNGACPTSIKLSHNQDASLGPLTPSTSSSTPISHFFLSYCLTVLLSYSLTLSPSLDTRVTQSSSEYFLDL